MESKTYNIKDKSNIYIELIELNEKESFCKCYIWLDRFDPGIETYLNSNALFDNSDGFKLTTKLERDVGFSYGIEVKILQQITHENYPFDSHSISINIDKEVKLKFENLNLQVSKSIQRKWSLIQITHSNNVIVFKIKRKPSYIITNFIFPIFLIKSFAFSIYFLEPSELFQRLSLLLTTLLTITAFKIILQNNVPENDQLNYIDKYYLICYFGLVLIILNTLISHKYVDIDYEYGIINVFIWVLVNILGLIQIYKNVTVSLINSDEYLILNENNLIIDKRDQFYPE
jgi:hypothetical protein